VSGVREALDVAGLVLLLAGAALSLTAAIGLLRFPDVLSRLHAATKPQVLGVLLVAVGVALRVGVNPDLGMLLFAGLAQLLTIPVSAHMIGRAYYRSGEVRDHLVLDDLREEDPAP
jgi:multicomponent Na+:H+ antiporter subunit G